MTVEKEKRLKSTAETNIPNRQYCGQQVMGESRRILAMREAHDLEQCAQSADNQLTGPDHCRDRCPKLASSVLLIDR